MAENNSAVLDVHRIGNGPELLDFLSKHSLLSNLDEFRTKFLLPLIGYLENGDLSNPFIVIDDTVLVAGEVFLVLRELPEQEAFFSALGIEPPSASQRQALQEEVILPLDGGERFDEQTGLTLRMVQSGHSADATQKLRRFLRQLYAMAGQESTERDADYESALENAIQTQQTEFAAKKTKLLGILSDRPNKLSVAADTNSRLEAHWRSLDPEQAQQEKDRVDALEREARTTLDEQLKKWQKDVLALTHTETVAQIQEFQRDHEIQGLLSKKGLLELFVLWTGTAPLADFVEALSFYCVHLVEPFNPRRAGTASQQAAIDLEIAWERITKALEKLDEYLTEQHKKQVEEAEKAFTDTVRTEILGEAAPSDEAAAEGGADQDTQEVTEEQKETEEVVIPPFPPEARPETIPTTVVPQSLQTEFAAEQLFDTREGKFFTLGQISRAKAELVGFTLLELKRELTGLGYTEQEIAQYLSLYEAQISSQVWTALLEKNGLRKALELKDIAEIARQVTANYLVILPRAFPPKNARPSQVLPPLNTEQQLRQYLSRQGLDPDVYLQQFSAESLKQALSLTTEFSQLGFDERLAIATRLLQGDHGIDESTATRLAQLFLELSNGRSLVEYTALFDDLAHSLYQKQWHQLSAGEQRSVSELLSHFYDNLALFGLIFGLSELRLLQTEVSQLQVMIRQMGTQRERLAGYNNHPLFQFVANELEPISADDPNARGEGDLLQGQEEASAPSQTRNVTLQVSVLFAVEMKVETRDALLTLVMQRPVSMQEFGGLLEYAQTNQQPAEPLDASLIAQLQNLQGLQENNAEEFAAEQQRAYQAFAEAEYKRKRLEVAIKLVKAAAKAYAGNPTELIALLSDAEARKIIEKELKDKGIKVGGVLIGGAAYTVATPIIQLVSSILSLITPLLQSLGLMGGTAASTGAAAAASATATGGAAAAEAVKDAAVTASTGVGKELAAASNTLTEVGSTLAKVPSQASTLVSQLGVGKSLGITVFSSIFGPILLSGVLTIIVITVIGSSLNDLPLGGIPYTGSGNRILNTTDMACIELDAGSFTSAGLGSDVSRIQNGIIQAMRSEYARLLCDIIPSGTRIMVAYNDSWGAAGHTTTAYGHEIGLSTYYVTSSRKWPATSMQFTIYHEMGHIFTKYTDIRQVHNQAMGSNRVRSYDYSKVSPASYPEESTAEGIAWFLFIPVIPNIYIGDRDVNLPREYPALTAAYENFFATLAGR